MIFLLYCLYHTTKSMIQRELKIYKNVMYERRIGMHILIYDIIPGTIFLKIITPTWD